MDSEGNKDECEEVFLDEQDIDEEELPEVDDESNSDVESDSDSDFGNDDSVSSVAFSADGKFLACGTGQGRVQVWDICSSSHKCTFDGPEDIEMPIYIVFGHECGVTCGDFTPDGHSYHTKGLTCLMITPDSALAITGSSDCSVRIVNIMGPGEVVNSLISHEDLIQCVGLSPRLPLVATGGGKELIIWEITHSLFRVVFEAHVSCLVWLGASQYIATGCADGKILIIDSLSGCLVKAFSDHSRPFCLCLFLPMGSFLSRFRR
ncbi:hypothetical protein IFM89_001205 [Coptis chinensis]|uniref:Angio-associated migratory cell protein n=1 Tax=Coptis chinensis TaxID=261450 RepID=A0A835HFG5_9MAGN|nr:hypothetical protein IFM89_001205 [Coptis chinensis]